LSADADESGQGSPGNAPGPREETVVSADTETRTGQAREGRPATGRKKSSVSDLSGSGLFQQLLTADNADDFEETFREYVRRQELARWTPEHAEWFDKVVDAALPPPSLVDGPALAPDPTTSMLVLQCQTGESVCIGKSVWLTVHKLRARNVEILIEAPVEIAVHRQELAENDQSLQSENARQRDLFSEGGALSPRSRLVIGRRPGESVCIGGEVVVTVIEVRKGRAFLGFRGLSGLRLRRKEEAQRNSSELDPPRRSPVP
jgi:carbon storage regulator CsrA